MDTRLMELLVCPLCKGPLTRDHERHEMVCAADRLAFPLRDGMAVMLETEARSLDAAPEPATVAEPANEVSASTVPPEATP